MRHFNRFALATLLLSCQWTAWAVDLAPASAPTEATNNEAAATAKKPAWEVKEVPATKQWVSDKLEVPLRSCPGDRC
ncbi:MAG TPA: hypothetical protein PLF09_09430, partial [Thiotrichales bacterium]|nr:hypothetical protein [Thiotrichales bacterium]